MTPLQTLAATATLLALSNLFMTFAWYGHLKHLCLVGAVHFIFP